MDSEVFGWVAFVLRFFTREELAYMLADSSTGMSVLVGALRDAAADKLLDEDGECSGEEDGAFDECLLADSKEKVQSSCIPCSKSIAGVELFCD